MCATSGKAVQKTGQFFSRFFQEVLIPNCRLRGIEEPHAPSFFKTLVEDNMRARFVQDTNSFEYPDAELTVQMYIR